MNNFLKQRYNKLIYALKDTFSEETAKKVYDKLMKDQLFYDAIGVFLLSFGNAVLF